MPHSLMTRRMRFFSRDPQRKLVGQHAAAQDQIADTDCAVRGERLDGHGGDQSPEAVGDEVNLLARLGVLDEPLAETIDDAVSCERNTERDDVEPAGVVGDISEVWIPLFEEASKSFLPETEVTDSANRDDHVRRA